MIYFSQLEKILQGKNLAFAGDVPVDTLLIDSRKVTRAEGALFFAIRGERHDGHRFLKLLHAHGVRQFVIEYTPADELEELYGSNIIQVTSSVKALQDLVAYHRTPFSIPVIGITGSNGKTIIKEWLYQILSKHLVAVKNPGSYNSQVGVPLSVWQVQSHHQLGIFEAGISKPGEMEKLQKVIRPTLGVFTNIGPAHNEGFASVTQKIEEKLRLFTDVTALIYCSDHLLIDQAAKAKQIPSFTWGSTAVADMRVHHIGDSYTLTVNDKHYTLSFPFRDPASVENALHCIAVMVYMGYEWSDILEGIRTLRAVPMRLELKEGINHCYIIDDTYNNDLGGIEMGLQFLAHQQQKKKKTLILSDVLESGLTDEVLVKRIALLAEKSGVDHFIGVGPVLSAYSNLFPAGSSFFLRTEDFLAQFDTDEFSQEVILVKGARVFGFEKIVQKLQRKVHGTVMEIDLNALVHNLNYFRSLISPSTKIMVMVKAFAYGSGSNEIANILQFHKIDYLGVAYADEGVELRKSNIQLPIMVMNPSEESFDQIILYRLEPEIYNFRILRALVSYLQGSPCKVHIKLDTGMHRLGFECPDLDELISLLATHNNLHVASIFSHLAGADDPEHDDFSRGQAETFRIAADKISSALGYMPLYHILNSPGILRLSSLQMDMVRLGIGLYGVDPTREGFRALRPVATLKTIISQIKTLKAGDTVGYGRRGNAEKDTVLATIAIGYADGFSRAFSRGVGEVLVKGKRCKVMGNVCMDMTMIDVTDVDASEGDEVIIFGKSLPIHEVAERIGTIPYEILTSTSERVKRVFVTEGL